MAAIPYFKNAGQIIGFAFGPLLLTTPPENTPPRSPGTKIKAFFGEVINYRGYPQDYPQLCGCKRPENRIAAEEEVTSGINPALTMEDRQGAEKN